MARSTIRRRILDGEALFGAWTDMASPMATEITGRAGYDWLIADLEHGAGTEAELLSVLLAAEVSGAAAFAPSAMNEPSEPTPRNRKPRSRCGPNAAAS